MNILSVLIIAALVATLAALGAGVISMVRGGAYDQAHTVPLMVSRVGFQSLAVILMLFALLLANG